MVKRKDGRWQEVVTVNGKPKYFYGKTKAEVLQKMAEHQNRQQQRCTFGAVADEWAGVHREEVGVKTWNNYRPHYEDIVARHGNTPIDEMTAADVVLDLKIAAAQKRSATIISTRRSIYSMIFDYALVTGRIRNNPATGVQLPKNTPKAKRRDAPCEDVFAIVMRNADKPFGLFAVLLACTGMRKAEALALTWGDIGEEFISVTKALDYTIHSRPVVKPPKTDAGVRDVPIMSVLRPYLKRPAGAKDPDLLFPSPDDPRSKRPAGVHLTERQYQSSWRRYCIAAGLADESGTPVITAHQLRHNMATMGFEAGVDELTMQAILGHASPTTTRDIYTHLRQRQRLKSVSKLDSSMRTIVSKSPESLEDKD